MVTMKRQSGADPKSRIPKEEAKEENPRKKCRYCVGAIYCCRHFKIDNNEFIGSKYANSRHNISRRKLCVCGKCTDASDYLDGAPHGTPPAGGDTLNNGDFGAVRDG